MSNIERLHQHPTSPFEIRHATFAAHFTNRHPELWLQGQYNALQRSLKQRITKHLRSEGSALMVLAVY
jgi:hypothetical protein